jgi:hypothetical protein
MNNAAGKNVGKIPLTVFGGAVTEMAPSDLPEGASPFSQDCDFLPGSVFSRGGRQNIISFANLFVEDLAGLAASIPDGHVPNESAWITPLNATLNIPGTYAAAVLNATIGGPAGTQFDKAVTNTGVSSTAGVIGNPTLAPEIAVVFTAVSNGAVASPGAGWTQAATAPIWYQLLNNVNTVNETQAIGGGPAAWASVLAFFGSNGTAPVFTGRGSGTRSDLVSPFTIASYTPTAGDTLFVALELSSNLGFLVSPENWTVSDGVNNWTQVASAFLGGAQGAQVLLFMAQNVAATAISVVATLVSGGTGGNVSINYYGFEVTNLSSVTSTPAFSQALDLTNFGFNIPTTDAITGLQVEVFGHQTSLSADAILTANLIQPNGQLSPLGIPFQLPLADAQTIAGTASQGWSLTLTPAMLNNPAFGVQLVAQAPGGEQVTFYIYAVKVKAFFSPSPPQNFNYIKTFEQISGVFTLALDSGGILWQEDAVNAPGLLNSIYTGILPNSFAKSITFQNTEYIAFTDLVQGTDMPRQWTGSNFDRVSSSGPAAAPSFGTTSTASTVKSITQNSPFLLPTGSHDWLLVSAGPAAHGTFGTPASPGNVMTIVLSSTDVPPTTLQNGVAVPIFKAGTNIQISGFPTINGNTVNNDPTGATNPAYYTITSVGSLIAGELSFDWITFQVPFTTFFNALTPGGCQIQSTLATLTTNAQVPYLEVGNQFALTGVTPSGWNNTFTVLQTPNAAVLSISQTSLTGNVAQYVFTLISGTAPVVGQFINVNGTLNGNGIFNVITAVITSVTPNSFSVSIQSPNINAAAETNASASIYGTVFVFDPAGTVTNPIIGNAGAAGSIATSGVIGVGIRQGVCMFLKRNGLVTPPSPFATFNVTQTASAITATGIPIGPPDTIARILAFTGANGGNYFYIQLPVTVLSNGQNVTYSSTVINDNVTTQATFSFPDGVLLNSTAIDIQGNNLFACIELPSCRGFLTYASRLIAWGVNTKIFNLLNLSFDGGIGVQNLQQLATQPAVPTYPLGWTVDANNGAGGQLLVSPLYGNSYYVKNTSGITKTLYGMITQAAYVTQLGTPIVLANTAYSCRVAARCPSGVQTGNLVVDFFSPVLNQIFGSFSIPFSSMTSNFQIFTGTLLPKGFGAVPKDLLIRVYASSIPNNGDFELDRIEPFITNQPSFSTQFIASYVGNQESFDSQTGPFGPAQNQQKANGGLVLFDTLYMLKESSWFSTSDNGVTEPFKWNWRTVSDKVGAIGIHSYDYGEAWAITACRAGLYYFEGGEPIKISQEIQTLWELINWKYGYTIWVRNDEANKTIKIGIPIATPNVYMPEMPANANPTTPNVVLNLSYRELNSGAQLASVAPIRSTFSGRLMAPEPARKWSFWNIACPYADNIDRGNNSKVLLLGTGYNDSKIFQINPAQLSDDGLAINSFYLTHGFPKPEIAEARGIDVLRSQFDYLELLTSGTGTLNTMIYLEDPGNLPPVILDAIPLDALTQGNNEIAVNLKANRYFIRVGTNAVGASWKLSTMLGILSPDPWAPVRGTARGSL